MPPVTPSPSFQTIRAMLHHREYSSSRCTTRLQDLVFSHSSGGAWVIRAKSEYEGTRLSPWASSQLCSKLGIPTTFVRKCSADLRTSIFSEFLAAAGGRRVCLLNICGEEGDSWGGTQNRRVRGVVSTRYTTIGDSHVVAKLTDALVSTPHEIEHYHLGDEIMSLGVRFTELHNQPTAGSHTVEVVYAGLLVRNSEVGRSSLLIEPTVVLKSGHQYFNPLASAKVLGSINVRHVGRRAGLYSALEDAALTERISRIIALGQVGVSQLVEAQLVRVQDPRGEVDRISAEASYLSDRWTSLVMHEIEEEVRVSKFRLAKAVMDSCRNMPEAAKHDMSSRVGRWLGLFEGSEGRFASLAIQEELA